MQKKQLEQKEQKMQLIKNAIDMIKNQSRKTVFFIKKDCIADLAEYLSSDFPWDYEIVGVDNYEEHCDVLVEYLKGNDEMKAYRDPKTQQLEAGHALKYSVDGHWQISAIIERKFHRYDATRTGWELLGEYETKNRFVSKQAG